MIPLIMLLWLGCGLAAAGFFNASMRAEFPTLNTLYDNRVDLGMGLLLGMAFGPVALLTSFFTTGFWFYGWTLSTSSRE